MAESTKSYASTLNNLIETCKDGEEGFRDAAEHIERQDLRSIFNEYSRQRTQFASELQNLVSRIGGDPENTGSVAASLHRGWINVKSAVTGRDDNAILSECERGEDSAVHNYQDALAHDLPSDIRSVVEEQYRQVLEAHNRIKSLRDNSRMDMGAEHSHHSELREDAREIKDDVRVGARRIGDEVGGATRNLGDDVRSGSRDLQDDITGDRPLRDRNY
jgi:uncharacterized protein (TIGR02284 family)